MLDGRIEKLLCVCVSLLVAAALTGCGGDFKSDAPGNYGDNLGATPGGAQDIAYARALINSGTVPPSDSITVEGLLSEHDLPVMGAPCEDLLCIRPVAGLAPDLATKEDAMWVHLGMTSGLPADYVRPPVDIVVVVDKSSSMSVDMTETNDAVVDILNQIGPDDRVAVVAFDDVARTVIPAVRGRDLDRPLTRATIEAIPAAGGANLMAGLELGYDIARDFNSGTDRMARVIVLSCGYPSVGETGTESFVELAEHASFDRIGLTFLGVLLSFDYRLAQRLASIRGGNYFYVEDLQRLEQLFEGEFDMMVTPLAYDLQVKLGVDPAQWHLDRVYGLPSDAGAEDAGFDVRTAFASRRGGGIVARLSAATASPDDAVAHVSLKYIPESAHGFATATATETVASSAANLSSAGLRKSVALVNMAERMKAAIDAQDRLILVELHEYLRAEADSLQDPALEAEVVLVERLIEIL